MMDFGNYYYDDDNDDVDDGAKCVKSLTFHFISSKRDDVKDDYQNSLEQLSREKEKNEASIL